MRTLKDKKGFTLIELLAVIVILGILMAIAIPAIRLIIYNSKKSTMISTIGSYISQVMMDVSSESLVLSEDDTIYAIPIECVGVQEGGKDLFGEWEQANENYWAYVLVYRSSNGKYTYGFTFKDSAGYGMRPIVHEKMNGHPKYISLDLDLWKPNNMVKNFEQAGYIEGGFKVNSDTTKFVVLEAEKYGVSGDGINTCTLIRKGNNYDEIEDEKEDTTPPRCGTTTGVNNKWTKRDITVIQYCEDDESGCVVDSYKSVYDGEWSGERGSTIIYDNAGNSTVCEYDVYRDVIKPTTPTIEVEWSVGVESYDMVCDNNDALSLEDRNCTITVNCKSALGLLCSVKHSLVSNSYSGVDWDQVLVYKEDERGNVLCNWRSWSVCNISGGTLYKYRVINNAGVEGDGILTVQYVWN